MRRKGMIYLCVGLLGLTLLSACAEDSGKDGTGASTSAESLEQTESMSAESLEQTENTSAESLEQAGNVSEESGQTEEPVEEACPLEDGIYLAKFDTDSSMFRVNETLDGMGTLTVKDGEMIIHVTLQSKKILNLYYGLAEDAKKDGATLLEPVVDKVTYPDGLSEEVYGFDVPVPWLDREFDLALVGSKGTWYDHKVSVSGVVPKETAVTLEDGEYQANATLTGGSGKATIVSPIKLLVKDGGISAVLVWNSKNYDYVIVDGVKYFNEAAEGENSTFTIPVDALGTEFTIIGDTIAMSTPHEIEYSLCLELVR